MRVVAAAAAIGLVTALALGEVRGFSFVNYDDFEFVVENPSVAGGLSAANVRWAFAHAYDAAGGPLTWLSHMLDVEMWGLDAGRHHLVSLVIHILNAVLLLTALHRMTGALGPSAFVAALFAVHPLHVESVAWIAERKDVLSGTFWMLGLLAYTRYVKKPSLGRYAIVAVTLALGLMAKPMVATLPVVFLLLDFWPLRRNATARLVAEKVPLLALSGVALLATLTAQQRIGAVAPVDMVPLTLRLTNAAVSCWTYIAKTFWPAGLVPFYPYPESVPPVAALAATLFVIGAGAVAIALRRRAPYVATGWFWYLATLAPVLGIVQVGGHARADRFTYLPLIGVFIVLSWGGAEALKRLRVPAAARTALAAAAVCLLAWTARLQAEHWRNGVALWTHAVAVAPGTARAHANLGVAWAASGDVNKAIDAYREALRLDDRDPRSHNNLGLALAQNGRREEALPHYRAAVRLDPTYVNARMNLANLLDDRGEATEAIEHYREALRLDPGKVLARANLAIALARSGRFTEAIAEMEDVVRRDPSNAEYQRILAMMRAERK